jgi:hypothetical protein
MSQGSVVWERHRRSVAQRFWIQSQVYTVLCFHLSPSQHITMTVNQIRPPPNIGFIHLCESKPVEHLPMSLKSNPKIIEYAEYNSKANIPHGLPIPIYESL